MKNNSYSQNIKIKPYYEQTSKKNFDLNSMINDDNTNNTNFTDYQNINLNEKKIPKNLRKNKANNNSNIVKYEKGKFNEFLATCNNRSFSQTNFMTTSGNNNSNNINNSISNIKIPGSYNYNYNLNIHENYFNYQLNKSLEGSTNINNTNNSSSLEKEKEKKSFFANIYLYNTTKATNSISKSPNKKKSNHDYNYNLNLDNIKINTNTKENLDTTIMNNSNNKGNKSKTNDNLTEIDSKNSYNNKLNKDSFLPILKNKNTNENTNTNTNSNLNLNAITINTNNFSENNNYNNNLTYNEKDINNSNNINEKFNYFDSFENLTTEGKNSKKFIMRNINKIKMIEEEKKKPKVINLEKKIQGEIKRKINYIINKKSKNMCYNYKNKNEMFNEKTLNHLGSEKFKEKFSLFHKPFRHKGMNFLHLKYVVNIDFIEKYLETPEEMILKTFSQEDLRRIQKDVSYYIKDHNVIKFTEALKLKNLKDILIMESKRGLDKDGKSDNIKFDNETLTKFKDGFFDQNTIDRIISNKEKAFNKKLKDECLFYENLNINGNGNGNKDKDKEDINKNKENENKDIENFKNNNNKDDIIKDNNNINDNNNHNTYSDFMKKIKDLKKNTESIYNKEVNEIKELNEVKEEVKVYKESQEVKEMREIFKMLKIREFLDELNEINEEKNENNNSIKEEDSKEKNKEKIRGCKKRVTIRSRKSSIDMMDEKELNQTLLSLSPKRIKINTSEIKQKIERKKLEAIVFQKEEDKCCKFRKTNFYHLYESGIERDHQRNDLLENENRYEETLYEVDKLAMRNNLNDNLTNKFVEVVNNKIQNNLLEEVYKKNPVLCTTLPKSSIDLPEVQKKSFYLGKTAIRNEGYEKKVDDIRNG
jgi:hypothetical protein